MKIINQPDVTTLGSQIQEILSNNHIYKFDSFKIVVAYAKKSGVLRLRQNILDYKKLGGQFKAVVGIDQRNTSIQALQSLTELADEFYVFHNESFSQTFHPKLYIFEKYGIRAIIFLGSSNLTAGGLFTNHELNIMVDLDLSNEEQRIEFESINNVYNACVDLTTGFSKSITPTLLEELVKQNYLGNEEVVQGRSDESSDGSEKRRNLFGSRDIRPPSIERVSEEGKKDSIVEPVHFISTQTNGKGFWKMLSKNDVSLTSSPGQIIIPIKFLTLFPPFTSWQETTNKARQADVRFNLDFINESGVTRRINQSRAIHYIPAPSHPRPNQELRFTFLNRSILESLNAGDILEFHLTNNPDVWFVVKLLRNGTEEAITRSNNEQRFGLI